MQISVRSQNFAILAFTALLLVAGCRKKQDFVPVKNEHVVSSSWMETERDNKSLWTKKMDMAGNELFTIEFDAPGITEELLKNSAVLVYGKFYGYDQNIWPDEKIGLLPLDIYHNKIGGSRDKWTSEVQPGKVTVSVRNTAGIYPGDVSVENQFRLIVVPKSALVVTGYKPIGSNPLAQYSEDELRNLSYDQLCKQAGIPQ